MNTQRKENIQYTTAISTLFSGVLMCFLSFFLNEYEIGDSVLMYFGQTLIFCGAVFGLNIMIRNKVMDAQSEIMSHVDQKMKKVDRLITDEEV